MIDVKAMREIVKAATPGEWMLGDENNSSAEVMLGAKHNLVVCLDRYDKNTGEQVISREQMLANARHIITFNPKAVTELLNALEATQTRIKELEADVVRRESERNEIGEKIDELYVMLAYRATQPPEQESAAHIADAIFSASDMGIATRIALKQLDTVGPERDLGGLNKDALTGVIADAIAALQGGKE